MALRPPSCSALQRNAFYSQHYTVFTEATLAEVMADLFWVHVHKQLRANDVITAIADGSYDVDFRITSIVPTTPNNPPKFSFRLIREAPGSSAETKAFIASLTQAVIPATPRGNNDRYEVKRGWASKWRLIDQMTGNVVCDGVSKDVAEAEKIKLETPQAQAA